MSKPTLKSLHNPEYVGPGVWTMFHIMSADAKTPEQKKAVLYFIDVLTRKFTCKTCQDHLKAFIVQDPPEQYVNESEGLFGWGHRAHNNANLITGKSQMSYDDAKDLFYGK